MASPKKSSPRTSGALLAGVPVGVRDELLAAFREITTNFRESRWEPSMLNGGKLGEVVYTIAKGYVDGAYPAKATKPRDMVQACRALEQAPSTVPRSIRIQIPRMVMALYEIRNNRSVGHVGGEVDPNHMDAVAVLYMSKWLLAELVRVFHGLSPEDAAAEVDAIVEREVAMVWTVGDHRRVLSPEMSQRNKALLLLYRETAPVAESELASWVEAKRLSDFRKDVLRPLHQAKLIEYNETDKTAVLSPLGARHVETKIPLSIV